MAFIGDKLWPDDDVSFLIRHHGKRSNRQLAQDLGRTVRAIEVRVRVLREQGLMPKFESPPPWTEADDRYLLSKRKQFTAKMLAEDTGRTETAVSSRLKHLKKQGWQIEAMPRGVIRSKQAEKARADFKPPELSLEADREVLRDEIAAFLSAEIRAKRIDERKVTDLLKKIKATVLSAPKHRLMRYLNMSVAQIVREMA